MGHGVGQLEISVPVHTSHFASLEFVREVEKRNEERLGTELRWHLRRIFSSAGVEGSQRTGKCMYIKARRNQGLQMLTTDYAALRGRDASEQRRA